MTIKSKITSWSTRLVVGYSVESDDPNYRRRIIMLNVITYIAIASLIPLGVTAHTYGNTVLGHLDHLMAGVLIGLLVHLHFSRQYYFAVSVGSFLMGLFFIYLFVTGGQDNSGHLWLYTFPLFVNFLLGARKGLISSFILLIICAVYLFAHPQWSSKLQAYPDSFTYRFIVSYLLVLIYSFVFEQLRERSFSQSLQRTQELEKASRAKSEFLSTMSHELRTPLNHIIGFTELVMDQHFGTLNETQSEYLNDVLSSSKHLLSLINDILDLSKIEAGKMELSMNPINLSDLLNRSLQMIKEEAEKKRIRIESQLENLPDPFMADQRKVKQILYNLLSNALKFTPEEGKITLSTTSHRSMVANASEPLMANRPRVAGQAKNDGAENWIQAVEIIVSDTGVGLENEDTERIFEKFEQIDGTYSRNFQGTGLGLALTRNLVNLHGGSIWARSNGVGTGSSFHVLLPSKPIRCEGIS